MENEIYVIMQIEASPEKFRHEVKRNIFEVEKTVCV